MIWARVALFFGVILAAVSILTGVYLQGRKDGKNACIAADVRERQIGELAAAKATDAAASAISKIKVQNRTVYSEVQREVMERTVYRDCLHTPEQLRRINSALTGEVEPAGSGILPPSDAASGPKFRGNDAQAH